MPPRTGCCWGEGPAEQTGLGDQANLPPWLNRVRNLRAAEQLSTKGIRKHWPLIVKWPRIRSSKPKLIPGTRQWSGDLAEDDDLEPEYDFLGAVRGKYYQRYQQGTNVVLLDADVAERMAAAAAEMRA